MASAAAVVVPSNGANIIQMSPGLPSVALQASAYTQYGTQQLGIPTNAPQQVPQKGPLERFYKAEPKVLGAVQIMIGLIYIGFGSLSFVSQFISLSAVANFPIWGGVFFISSGSLCVSVANTSNRGLVISIVITNTISAIVSLIGISLHLRDLTIYNPSSSYVIQYTGYYYLSYGLSCLLLLFGLLELCIAVSLAYFGCQATCCSNDQPTMVFVPYQVIRGEEVADEQNPLSPAPTYDNTDAKSE
ncbi:membrane-spanning 4-domains subfamily A member 8-like isoform X1 [Erythrolamprus reginae]|uniref:membrane-spanning 4-domains subfamily A member 8-like isoform X1 n=1 Tax=Erythrolamprus reginae TaxID=121349 RepID=UPI00396C54C7